MLIEFDCFYCKQKTQKEITKKKYKKIPIFCSRNCQLRGQNFEWDRADDEEKKAKLLQNFYRNITIKNGCWNYKSKSKNKNYYQVEVGKRKYDLIHRLSWEIHNGKIPEGKIIRHLCNSPSCVRPSHLSLGTYQDNSNDMVSANRQAKGTKHGMSKLNDKKVLEVKKMLTSGISCGVISKNLKVSKSTIQDIYNNITWKHIPWPVTQPTID